MVPEGLGCPNKCIYAKALENEIKELKKEIESLKKDFLTGAYNRHILDEKLNGEYKEKLEKGWYYNLIMIDLNDLHKVNREQGYDAGDKFIIETYEAIKKFLKDNEIDGDIYRIGGDEFLIITEPYNEITDIPIENIEYGISSFCKTKSFGEAKKEADAQIIKKKTIERL